VCWEVRVLVRVTDEIVGFSQFASCVSGWSLRERVEKERRAFSRHLSLGYPDSLAQ
jgi:hypothetical protein